jgi:hypothetical protein
VLQARTPCSIVCVWVGGSCAFVVTARAAAAAAACGDARAHARGAGALAADALPACACGLTPPQASTHTRARAWPHHTPGAPAAGWAPQPRRRSWSASCARRSCGRRGPSTSRA